MSRADSNSSENANANASKIHQLHEILQLQAQSSVGSIHSSTTLAELGYANSIGVWKLTASLNRRFGQLPRNLEPSMRVDELEQLMGLKTKGQSQSQSQSQSQLRNPSATPITITSTISPKAFTVGIDLESMDEMPTTDDYRNHEFYSELFTNSELSLALMKPDPKQHLLGLFCAKEALKKAHPMLIDLHPRDIAISHDQRGRPQIKVHEHAAIDLTGVTFDCSISHAGSMATAVVLVQRELDQQRD